MSAKTSLSVVATALLFSLFASAPRADAGCAQTRVVVIGNLDLTLKGIHSRMDPRTRNPFNFSLPLAEQSGAIKSFMVLLQINEAPESVSVAIENDQPSPADISYSIEEWKTPAKINALIQDATLRETQGRRNGFIRGVTKGGERFLRIEVPVEWSLLDAVSAQYAEFASNENLTKLPITINEGGVLSFTQDPANYLEDLWSMQGFETGPDSTETLVFDVPAKNEPQGTRLVEGEPYKVDTCVTEYGTLQGVPGSGITYTGAYKKLTQLERRDTVEVTLPDRYSLIQDDCTPQPHKTEFCESGPDAEGWVKTLCVNTSGVQTQFVTMKCDD